MNYSLGNTLSRAKALNPDGLALDLAFALDKTLTARKGPTPTFTRGSTGTFAGSNGLIQSAAINVPRFDYDPATGASKGLLIEESRTNLLLRSEELGTSPWGVSGGIVITPNNAISPDGLQTADTIAFTTSGSLSQTASMGSAGVVATFSIFVKAATSNGFIRIIVADNVSVPTNFFGGWFNTLTGLWATTSTLGSGVVITSLVTNLNNGWYRISITGSMAGISNYSPFMYITDSDNSTIRSTSVSQHWWGAQVEAGAFPLSYIPTTSGTAARSADVCSIIGTDFSSFYNQSEGTMFAAFSMVAGFYVTGRSIPVCQASNNTFNELVRIGSSTASPLTQAFDTTVGGTLTRASASTNLSLISGNKSAGAYKAGDNGVSSNGSVVVASAPAAITTQASRFDIGSLHPLANALPLCGHIARIQYFRKRLSNAKLQALTAP